MAVSEFFRWLNDAYGLNFSIFYDPYDRDRFLLGLWTTLYLSVVCIVFSIVIGVFGACLQGARSAVLRALLQGYVQLFRNTPPLVQLLFFYFGVGTALGSVTGGGSFLSNIGWAILSFFALRRRLQRRDLPLGRRGGAGDDPRGGGGARLFAARRIPLRGAAARAAHRTAGARQQPRQPRQDDDACLRHRGPGAALRLRPGLVGGAERARDDERASRVLYRLC